MLLREECERSSQGKKVADGRCRKTIEAQPLSGQTCPIEPADGVPQTCRERNFAMAVLHGWTITSEALRRPAFTGVSAKAVPCSATCSVQGQVSLIGKRAQMILDGIPACASGLGRVHNGHAPTLARQLED